MAWFKSLNIDTARKEYPKLWEQVEKHFEDQNAYTHADIVSLVVGTCSYCYEASDSCCCWNDE